jgi:hypothetical protein
LLTLMTIRAKAASRVNVNGYTPTLDRRVTPKLLKESSEAILSDLYEIANLSWYGRRRATF